MVNDDNENKDYIINLRVSRKTYDKIKSKAKENRETISNLLRKVIDDSSEIISDLSCDVFGDGKKFNDIISYHKVFLAQDVDCSKCNQKISSGESVTVGETKTNKKYYFCLNCKA